MLVCASLNFRPPATAPSTGDRRPRIPPTAPPTPPALFSENTTDGVRTKSAATIWPPPMFEPCRDSPACASARSCMMFCMPAPRSTTMKQFDCWIIIRMRPTGEDSWYRVSALRISLCGSTTATAPIGLSQCSRPLSPVLPSVPAAPFTTLPPWPCFGWVIPWPWADAAIKVAQAATAIARTIPLLNISPPGKRFL